LGLPLPTESLLVAAGALAGTHRMNLSMAIVLPIAATVIGNFLWYEIGRLKGVKILNWLCHSSHEAGSCVHRAQVRFERNGPLELVLAKFVPGLNAIAPPLAGITGMPLRQFSLFNGLGTVLWVGAFTGAGYIFSGQLKNLALGLGFLGRGIFVLTLAGLLLYAVRKRYIRRRSPHSADHENQEGSYRVAKDGVDHN
jgi:membrane protein DedA with SNARE-associated domain